MRIVMMWMLLLYYSPPIKSLPTGSTINTEESFISKRSKQTPKQKPIFSPIKLNKSKLVECSYKVVVLCMLFQDFMSRWKDFEENDVKFLFQWLKWVYNWKIEDRIKPVR